MADTSGAIVKRIDYDTFGNIISDSNTAMTVPFGFAGGLHDRDTGLVRFGYRDYSPELGRFVAKDPIDFAGGDTNLYAYSMSDPVNFVDPLGLDYYPNIVINLDPTPYRAYGDSGPNSPNQDLVIPPGGHLGPIPIIGMTPPWWDVDFICSPSGWRKVKVGGVISGGCVIGGIDPPPDWTPPSQCP